jgi:hypothetical protein
MEAFGQNNWHFTNVVELAAFGDCYIKNPDRIAAFMRDMIHIELTARVGYAPTAACRVKGALHF